MKKLTLLVTLIVLLGGCSSLLKNNGGLKIHRTSGKKPSWATETVTPIVTFQGKKYFLVSAEGEDREYLKSITLDAKAHELVLDYYSTNSLRYSGLVREFSYWEQYENQNKEGVYYYSYKVWALYSIPKLSP